jgi:hypothetical protein
MVFFIEAEGELQRRSISTSPLAIAAPLIPMVSKAMKNAFFFFNTFISNSLRLI